MSVRLYDMYYFHECDVFLIYAAFLWQTKLKSNSHLPKKKIICFNDSPSKIRKNAFYFILKALFVLKMFKPLSWLFGHVEKTAWSEKIRLISKFMTSQPG